MLIWDAVVADGRLAGRTVVPVLFVTLFIKQT